MAIVTFNSLPNTLDELKSLPQASLTSPEGTVALTVAALCVYPTNPNMAIEMLNFLKGPEPLSPYEKQFLADRFRGKDYIAKSYFAGATPENNYEPNKPYSVDVLTMPSSNACLNEGYMTLFVKSGGADSPRQVRLRTKPSTGQWFLVEQMLLPDIRIPVASDPWA